MMKENEFNTTLEKAFQEKLKAQILIDGYLFSKGKKILIEDVGTVKATLQNQLNISELMSVKGTFVQFAGNLDFTIRIKTNRKDEVSIPFGVIGLYVKYLGNENKFIFDEKIMINLTNYQ